MRVRDLFDLTQDRPHPGAAAQAILDLGYPWQPKVMSGLRETARTKGNTYLADEFHAPQAPTKTVQSLRRLLDRLPLDGQRVQDLDVIRKVLEEARFRVDEGDGATRKVRKHLTGMSRRQYKRMRRTVANLDQLLPRYKRAQRMDRLHRVAKISFAHDLGFDEFGSDLPTACFVAYMTANLARRSLFTASTQARAFDSLAEKMFVGFVGENTNWYAIAHVFPRADVLRGVSIDNRMVLLGKARTVMSQSAVELKRAWEGSDINLETMIVRRGNDSSTWNALAGSWNRGRDYWIALMQSLGLYDSFDQFLPGKVLRLMAADVASWHRSGGDQLHGDTGVFASLPKPWDVMLAEDVCGREAIEEACLTYEIDPLKTGWSRARARTAVDAWRPTYATVHGVEVEDPELAKWLRKIGVFSGKLHGDLAGLRDVEVERDEHGAAIGAHLTPDKQGATVYRR